MDEVFGSYEPEAGDVSSLKRDQSLHPRTSIASLSYLAKSTAMVQTDKETRKQVQAWMKDPYRRAPNKAQYWPKPCHKERLELAYAKAWLSAHQSELPAEIETEDGRLNSQRKENTYENYGERADNLVAVDLEEGLYDIGQRTCDLPLSVIAERDEELHAYVKSYGVDLWAYLDLMPIRGEVFRKRHAEAKAKARWRGMYGARAGENMTALLDKTGGRKSTASNAKPLPSNLGELLDYDTETDTLTWKVARGRVKAGAVVKPGRVRISGEDYYPDRIKYALKHGDPQELNVHADGTASSARYGFEGSYYLRDDGMYSVQAYIAGKQYMILEVETAEDAEFAVWCAQWAARNHKRPSQQADSA